MSVFLLRNPDKVYRHWQVSGLYMTWILTLFHLHTWLYKMTNHSSLSKRHELIHKRGILIKA